MAQVISATTSFNRGAGAKYQRFMLQAGQLLAQARTYAVQSRWDQALEMAYQAALRTAGARISLSAVARRKRKPSSAWDQLALVDVESKRWAEKLAAFSRLRGRVASGLESDVPESTVFELMELTSTFMAEVEAEQGFGSLAA